MRPNVREAAPLREAACETARRAEIGRIGIFHATLPVADRKPGGVELFVHRLGCGLADAGFDVEVISLSDRPRDARYRHRRVFARLSGLCRRRIFLLLVMPVLLNFVRFKDYDVIHFHGSDWACLFRGCASVRTFHGSALLEARTATSRGRRLSQYLIYPLEHLARRLADVALGVSEQTNEIYRTDGTAKLLVPEASFHPGEKTARPSFVFIGTWAGRKRGQFVAERFTNGVLPRLPDAKLYMACDHVPVSDAIVDLGRPSDAALAKILRESWALLSASTYEGFGIPYLEAMRSGTAIITTENSGADHLLAHGRYGCIVKDEEFAAKIVALAENEGLRRAYEAAGQRRAAEFSERQVLAEHIAHYQQAIARFAEKTASRRHA
jgi:glycosyltransferase involved in cell wall biosynthesis